MKKLNNIINEYIWEDVFKLISDDTRTNLSSHMYSYTNMELWSQVSRQCEIMHRFQINLDYQ